ncbi:FadR/GntR family transcriptional regulator [Salibacterium aidingense]|uniref:FadR/GntR family transcriptional regulator n=1 Tax=Salibacterium aidingense TaxID=384933 RepID=UPI00040ADD1F|nr:FadR/GntR family transcriptional regulator [Salibacterium aidingense]
MFEKLSRTPVVEEALQVLKQKIITMNPEERLPPENQLVNDLGVSRQTIREVLITLQAEGYIQIRRGKGAYVMDKEDFDRKKFFEWFQNNRFKIQELIEVRLAIEPFVARLAANKMTEEEIYNLEKLYSQFLNELEKKDAEKIVLADEAFHEAILESSRNDGLRFIYNSFIPRLHEYRSRALSPPANPNLAIKAHQNILDALKNRDDQKAYNAMTKHILESQNDVINTVQYIADSDIEK